MSHQICPKCGSKMFLKIAKKGPHKGEAFMGCTMYPKCKHILKRDCPKCGSPMVIRLSKRGVDPGRYFWGCSNYPECKVTFTIYDQRERPSIPYSLYHTVSRK